MKIKSDKARLILCARISIEIIRHHVSLGIMRCHSLFASNAGAGPGLERPVIFVIIF